MNTLTIVDKESIQDIEDVEVFELISFDRTGGVSLQTSKSNYFYATAYFYAARDLVELRSGNTERLEYGIDENRITDQSKTYKLCIDAGKLVEVLDADKVECSHPGVEEFMLRYVFADRKSRE